MPKKKDAKKEEPKNMVFDVAEFGRRLALVRENVLNLSQSKLAPLVNTRQALISRLESGIGGNIHMVFEIVDYLNRNGFRGHMLFRSEFDIALFKSEIGELEYKKNLISGIDAIEKAAKANYENIVGIKKLIV